MQGYRELKVWQKAMDLVEYTYSLISFLPQNEKYALSDQMRRVVVSIPSNIAEGREGIQTKNTFIFLLWREVLNLNLKHKY